MSEIDPSDYERPRVKGSVQLGPVLVHVLMTGTMSGDVVASAVVEWPFDGGKQQSVGERFRAPTHREAWAQLAAWVGLRIHEVAP